MTKIDMSVYGLRGQYEVPSEEYRIGRILSQEKGLYGVISIEGEQTAAVSGRFRYTVRGATDFPAVGDFVLIDNGDICNNAVIHRVLPRKSMFVRKAAGTGFCEQAVAANIDTVFICMSLYRDFNLRRLERYLSAAWDSGALPVIVLTKADLCDDVEYYVSMVRDISFGTDIITTSTSERDSYKRLLPYIGFGKTASLIGSSGVGKSTLINSLLGEDVIETGGLRSDGKGRHTTTRRELFLIDGGGAVIDTPGMRELGLWAADEGLDRSFADIEALSEMCRFKDCTHGVEPGCAVKEAINDGRLSEERFSSYMKLKTENAYCENTDEYLAEKKRKFKSIAKINKDRRK